MSAHYPRLKPSPTGRWTACPPAIQNLPKQGSDWSDSSYIVHHFRDGALLDSYRTSLPNITALSDSSLTGDLVLVLPTGSRGKPKLYRRRGHAKYHWRKVDKDSHIQRLKLLLLLQQ